MSGRGKDGVGPTNPLIRFQGPLNFKVKAFSTFRVINARGNSAKGVIRMAEERKRVVVPLVNIMHNEDDSGFLIEVDLAGASRESVELDMGTAGFCVKAEAEAMRYESCFLLAHEVKPEEAKAKFESGLLIVRVPFKESLHGHKVKVE